MCAVVYRCFNPRAREGRDNRSVLLAKYLIGFNPRAREGRDDGAEFVIGSLTMFQSTRP